MNRLAVLALAAGLAACDDVDDTTWLCDPVGQAGCGAGQSCEYVGSAGAACFAPVLVAGTVNDPVGLTSVAGARVVALDANRAPVSSVAVTDLDGVYQLGVRAARDVEGRPVPTSFVLRADAQGYQTFPGGIRPALPIDTATAVPLNGRWVVSSPLTAIRLLPLAGGDAFIAGTVARRAGVAPPLVVAEPVGVTTVAVGTGIADRDGSYAIYNLRQGVSYAVRAYSRGANHAPATSGPLAAGANTVNVAQPVPTSTVLSQTSGLIYNNGASSDIEVTLVVESTYLTTLDRGESPPGLTVHSSGTNGKDYTFTGVPDGTYRVLAAFGIDGAVRDQSTGGNTAPPVVTVNAGAVAVEDSFKVVPAVDLQTIGGTAVGTDPVLTVTTSTPSFVWRQASGVANVSLYRVLVFDPFGRTIWSQDYDPAGLNEYTLAYPAAPGAPELVPGLPYQLRILAFKMTPDPFEQMSQTEDLLGVFTYVP